MFRMNPASWKNKTFPPTADATMLSRERLLDQTLRRWSRGKALMVQAQAGQGKSTFSAQLLQKAKIPFCWYQLGAEDQDPVLFLATLYDALRQNLAGFGFPLLEQMLAQGDVSALEAPRLAGHLADELRLFLDHEFCLVLDDLHLLEGSPLSLALVNALLVPEQKKLRFMGISRRPVPGLELDRDPLLVRNSDLAFSRSDIAELFSLKLHHGLTAQQVQELHRLTEGWIMGLLMLSASLEGSGTEASLGRLKPGDVPDYFFHEILGGFPPAIRRTLLKLSLLEEIPAELMDPIAAEEGVDANLLQEMEQRNFFLRRLDEAGAVFVFHHLFRDTLRTMAGNELSEKEQRDVHRRAGAFYWERQNPEKALEFYIRGADYEMADHILSQVGLEMRAANRIVTLFNILKNVPEVTLRSHAWLCYFAGICFQKSAPLNALFYLENAQRHFAENDQPIFELCACIDILFFHFFIDGHFPKGRKILPRAEHLYRLLEKNLDNQMKFWACNGIANAHALFSSDVKTANEFYEESGQIFQSENIESNFHCFYSCNISYFYLFRGSLIDYNLSLENVYLYLDCIKTSIHNKLFCFVSLINYYAIDGDYINFDHYEKDLLVKIDGKVIENSVALFSLNGFRAEIALSSDQSIDITHLKILGEKKWINQNARAALLQFIAYTNSLKGLPFDQFAKESLEIHRAFSSPFYQAYNEMMIGGAYAQNGNREEAESLLQSAIERSEQIGEEFLRCAAYAHRAFLHLKLDGPEAALEDLGRCLEIMRRNRYPRFLSWCPQLMKPLLPLAVAHGIESDYARKLAAERLDMAILPDGGTLPLLHFHTLGGFEARFGEDLVLKGADLSTIQRRLISLLLSSPHLQMPLEELQAILWPESPAGKSRSKFDTLLSRLRSTLDKHLAPHSSRHFLSLAKGVLRLENCRIDAREFQTLAEKGVQHARRKEPWQAGNAFRNAFHRWKGTFLPQALLDDPPLRFREGLESLAIEAALAWHSILEKENRNHEAESVLTLALRLDRTNDALVRSLHRLHMEKGKPKRAAQVLRDYSRALAHEEYTEEEIRDILREISPPRDPR